MLCAWLEDDSGHRLVMHTVCWIGLKYPLMQRVVLTAHIYCFRAVWMLRASRQGSMYFLLLSASAAWSGPW